jgi:hypothetical protein
VDTSRPSPRTNWTRAGPPDSWTAEPDALPLRYEFGYTAPGGDPAPIAESFAPATNWTAPALGGAGAEAEVEVWVAVRDAAGSLTRRAAIVTVLPPAGLALAAAAGAADARLAGAVADAVARLDAPGALHQIDAALSLLNQASGGAGAATRAAPAGGARANRTRLRRARAVGEADAGGAAARSAAAAAAAAADARFALLGALREVIALMEKSRAAVHGAAASLRRAAAVPAQLGWREQDAVLARAAELLADAHRPLFGEDVRPQPHPARLLNEGVASGAPAPRAPNGSNGFFSR